MCSMGYKSDSSYITIKFVRFTFVETQAKENKIILDVELVSALLENAFFFTDELFSVSYTLFTRNNLPCLTKTLKTLHVVSFFIEKRTADRVQKHKCEAFFSFHSNSVSLEHNICLLTGKANAHHR